MKNYTHLIWDFNGTIYNDVDACIKSANRLLAAHGLKPLSSRAEYQSYFGFPIIDYYHRLGFDFAKTPYDTLAVEWVEYYLEESRSAGIYEGIVDTMDFFREKGLEQILLSATEREMLERQLNALGLKTCFDEVLGQDTIYAYGKTEIALAWRKSHPDARLLLIGDTEHDAEVARAMGGDCILLACGHRPRSELEKCGCLAVLENHAEMQLYFGKNPL